MMPGASRDITELLLAWNQGDDRALEQLMPLVHDELHRLAHRYMGGERPGHTLQTTALVNEAYLRLVDSSRVRWQNRAHFFAVSAQLMRRILVDFARARQKLKRGGNQIQLSLDEAVDSSREPTADVIGLDDALKTLAAFDERKSKVVELRFFGGLTVEETAEVLDVSPVTVARDWGWRKRGCSGNSTKADDSREVERGRTALPGVPRARARGASRLSQTCVRSG